MPGTRKQSSPPKRVTRTTGRATGRTTGRAGPGRQRNPRGQGERLRDDIIEAASRMLADPASPPLTLRGVAREVGVAATSVYLHFNDIESLVLAVAERQFGELMKLQDEAAAAGATACDRVRAAAVAYCEFGLRNPGHYQLMFSRPLPGAQSMQPPELPGYAAFHKLVDAVAECIDRDSDDAESFRTALLIWQQLHGTVNLRISRSRFPFPSLDESVTDGVDRILASAVSPPSASGESSLAG